MASLSVRLPLMLDSVDGFSMIKDIRTLIRQNLKMLILTNPGERIMEPTFGLGLKNKLFENNINVEELKLQIGDKINQFIPQVSLMDVDAQLDQNLHTLLITISYKIMNTGESDAIEINFNQST